MKINLLPQDEISKSRDIKIILRKSVYAILASLFLIGCINIFFEINKRQNQSRYNALKSKHDSYVELKREVDELTTTIQYLNQEFNLISSSVLNKFYWSEKLLELSKIMPREIWLKRIKIDKRGEMKLEGYLLPSTMEESPLSILSSFIKTLQSHEEFSKDFSEISLGNVRVITMKKQEILEFNITLL
ncbi:MAG: hypothetical protein JSW40_03690 [Candidatus Omnitrophota bacterium]|nr:MAG: hypothetical protein JSW40_03690 [Candidatus Omnitrophota bacterium]